MTNSNSKYLYNTPLLTTHYNYIISVQIAVSNTHYFFDPNTQCAKWYKTLNLFTPFYPFVFLIFYLSQLPTCLRKTVSQVVDLVNTLLLSNMSLYLLVVSRTGGRLLMIFFREEIKTIQFFQINPTDMAWKATSESKLI